MIEVRHLTKRYGNHMAVSDLSFKIEKGVIYGKGVYAKGEITGHPAMKQAYEMGKSIK